MKKLFIAILILSAGAAEARVFKFDSEGFATYFAAGAGDTTLLGNQAFADSSGANTVFSSSATPAYNQMVEFGFLTTIKGKVNVKIGAQVVEAKTVEAEGANSGGTKLMDLTSDIYVFNPNLVLEFNFKNTGSSRWMFYTGIGYATMSLDNSYVLNAAGQAAYPSVGTDFIEKVESTYLTYDLGFAYEILAVDSTTFHMNLGYRFMEGLDLRYKSAGKNLNEADFEHNKNDRVKFNDGSNRQLNMGGAYVGLGFRFYIDLSR